MIKLFEISTVENCDSSIIPGATNISRTTEAHDVFLVTCQDGWSHQLCCENSAWGQTEIFVNPNNPLGSPVDVFSQAISITFYSISVVLIL